MESKNEAINPKHLDYNEMIKDALNHKDELRALGYDVDMDGTVTNAKTGRQVFIDDYYAGARNTARHAGDKERYTRISMNDGNPKDKPFDYKGYLDTDRPNKEKGLNMDSVKRNKVSKFKTLNFETQPNEKSQEYKKYSAYINRKQAEIDDLNAEIDLTQAQLDKVKQAQKDFKANAMKKEESISDDNIDVSGYATIVEKQIPIDDEYLDTNADRIFDEELLLKPEYDGTYIANHIRIAVDKTLEDNYVVSAYYFLDSSGYCAWIDEISSSDLDELGGLSGVVREIALMENRTFEMRGSSYATGETPDEMGIEFPDDKLTEAQIDVLQPAYFSVDSDDAFFKGYHYPRYRWNGWAIPYFTLDVAKAVAERYSGGVYDYEITYDEQKDAFHFIDKTDEAEYYEEDIPKQTLSTTEGTLDLYGIGGGCWIWDAYTKDEMERCDYVGCIFESLQHNEPDFKYKGIWIRHLPDTNTVQFIVSSEKADELNLDDTVIDTIDYNNQSEAELKEYVDSQFDNKFFTE